MSEKMHKPVHPRPEPLSGAVHGSFAYKTITERMPRIAREILDENDFIPQVRANLESLIRDIPAAPIRILNDSSAPDAKDWEAYVSPYLAMDWLSVPWFFAEIYFYRRILEATGYYVPGAYQEYDPFQKQKTRILESAENSVNRLAGQLDQAKVSAQADPERMHGDLRRLLVMNVWGNQADLSMWSAAEERPDHRDEEIQHSHLLVDNTEVAIDYLLDRAGKQQRVDFILDNYGLELANDMGLADYLLSTGIAGRVTFHAKPHPYYVSDAMIKDIHAMLDWFASRQDARVRALGRRFTEHIEAGRLRLTEDLYWTSPLSFWEMPRRIRSTLESADLIISKGDLNYRRLAADLDWPPITPFGEVVGDTPAAILALRVLKSELALGLTAERVRELNEVDPDWLVSGNWGVIQFLARETGAPIEDSPR